MKRKLSNRSLCLLLVLAMLWGMLPVIGSSAEAAVSSEPLSLSILGDSISTYTGVSNVATVNSTLKGGAIYYNAGTLGVYRGDTWWQQTVDQMDLKLLVNNSWSGSCVFKERSGTVGAYLDRCVQLHNGEGEEPDIIAVYLGTNDFWTFPNSLGTAGAIDYGSLIVEGERTAYAEPATTCEAYAIMLHKMKRRYPNAEIYCFTLLPRGNQSESKVQQLQEFNTSLKEIAAHFGASIVDLYNDCGIKADENFKFYVADNSLHPGPAGMDAITGCFRSSLLDNSRYWTDPVYHVSYDLNNVIVDQGTASAVSEGSCFTCSFTVPIDHILKVKATMGGEDITDSCFADKTLTVGKVSGDLHIVASSELAPDEPENFRWECRNDQMVSITDRGNIENTLTMTQGSITDGKFKNVKYTLNEAVILKHDCPWILEWRSSGTWSDTTDGALLFAGNASSSVADTPYLYRRHNSDFIAFGVAVGSRYYNYGVALGANGIDATAEHTYRLENRIFEDGSNMVYLLVDAQEVGPMNHHWIGGTDQKTTVDWVNGRDFVFTNMGTSPHTIGNCTIDYIQVSENGHVHSYTSVTTAPTCAEQGFTAYTCVCGDYYVSDFMDATGEHHYENGICAGCGATDPEMPKDYRWECQNDQMVSITDRGNIENTLTMTQGSITDGKFKNVKYTLNEAVILKHDCPWILEWRSSGTWSDTTDGALLFAGNASSSVADTPYLYRRHNSDFIAFGVAVGSRYYNYGVALGANGIDATAEHTYRLENRIFEDGSNMVYLLVDAQEVGPMNHHWIGGTDQKTTVDWVNGRDFVFTNMGTSPHTIGNCTIDYIQVWENGHVHSYEKGICTGCGEEDPDYVTVPTLTLKAPTLEFKDMICVVAFFTAENIENVDQMGMITYAEEVDVIDIQTAHHVIPGATYNEETGRYCSRSQGIHAKYLADTLYLACYAKLTDGTYVYTKLAPYSPISYATNQLKNSTDMKLKQLVVAMLNYGAAAQSYFAHKVETPANASLSAEQLALPDAYRSDMVATVPAVDESKQGSFVNNRGFSLRKPAVSFEGAFSINYFFTPAYSPQNGITLYYWTEADFCANDILTVENASGFFQMTGSGLEQYRGDLVGIAAKNLSQAIYVAAVYTDGSTTWTSGVLGYSIGAYCSGLATKGGAIADLAMATAVYGYHAKAYFG